MEEYEHKKTEDQIMTLILFISLSWSQNFKSNLGVRGITATRKEVP